jgi:glycosyltransferase involved in cell wall biosynthesis
VNAGSELNKMRILHVFRNPVGGLFRHVRDLARGQTELGHDIAIFCDSRGGGAFADTLLEETRAHCGLGIFRSPISRAPGLGDIKGVRAVMETARKVKADVIHGHGAKGGLYARAAGWRLGIPSTYTPHAGSLNYDWNSAAGIVYLTMEMVLRRIGTGVCFVCNYEKHAFDQKIGINGKPNVTVYNGLWPEDFKVVATKPDATDFITLGEIRPIKGIDVMLRALARIDGATVSVIGDGPSKNEYQALAKTLGIADRVRFTGSKPWVEAVTMGRIMLLPSHNESFPYVVLEAGAAGLPLIATDVGGVAEVVPSDMLCPPGNVDALHAKMMEVLNGPGKQSPTTVALTTAVREKCSALGMCRELANFYGSLRAEHH